MKENFTVLVQDAGRFVRQSAYENADLSIPDREELGGERKGVVDRITVGVTFLRVDLYKISRLRMHFACVSLLHILSMRDKALVLKMQEISYKFVTFLV